MSDRRPTSPDATETAPCNHCGAPVPFERADDPERIVRCGYCGTALLVHVEHGVRWTEEVGRLEKRTAGEATRLKRLAARRETRRRRRQSAVVHTATDWKAVGSGCGFAAFGVPFFLAGLIAMLFVINGAGVWVLLHVLAFGGFGVAMIGFGLRQAWSNRRTGVRADGTR
ncbi:MAG: hypothetical protein AAF907_03305, partial [Planctomycetota bacterium]